MLHALADAGPAARCGGCTAHAAGRRNRSRPRRASLLSKLPRAHLHVCYSRPGADDALGRDYQSAGRLSAGVLTALDLPRDGGRCTCAGRPRLHDRRRGPLTKLGLGGGQIHDRDLRRAAALTPGIAAAARCRRTSPTGVARHRPAGRVRAQRPDRPLGPAPRAACWSLPRPATCRCAGPAVPACATPASPAWYQGRSATCLTRSTIRPTVTCWSAARSRAATSYSTCEVGSARPARAWGCVSRFSPFFCDHAFDLGSPALGTALALRAGRRSSQPPWPRDTTPSGVQ